MSGSSGSYTPSSNINSSRPCEKLSVNVILATPVPAMLALLKEKDTLEIVHIPSNTLEAHNGNGEYVGTVLNPSNDRIIECIRNGVEFIGIVLSISGAKCNIVIKPNL
jgi:hypothetical protein